ncbi:hypothetical protein B0T10DRAFT_532558 [Thelonectria olida]|uniref:HMG box domain-containing protein n=1 Tax=Thelonectria olida TaxID=1576542 RepID=A0A9P8VTV0_9HYPO|nr:hypothetical protein B0T10DRAFT_532558 [Thelonectria olida]
MDSAADQGMVLALVTLSLNGKNHILQTVATTNPSHPVFQPRTFQDYYCPSSADAEYTWTEWLESDWLLFPDIPDPIEQPEDVSNIASPQCHRVDVLSNCEFSPTSIHKIEQYVQRTPEQRRLEAAGGKAKRPPNAFILYRIAFRHAAERVYGTKLQQVVSKICGESWLRESEQLRTWFKTLAITEKANHEKSLA